jgi:hypothetical protein
MVELGDDPGACLLHCFYQHHQGLNVFVTFQTKFLAHSCPAAWMDTNLPGSDQGNFALRPRYQIILQLARIKGRPHGSHEKSILQVQIRHYQRFKKNVQFAVAHFSSLLSYFDFPET